MSGTQTAVFDAEALGIIVTHMGELFLIARRPPNNEQPSPDGLQGVRGDGDGEEVCEHEPQKLGDFLFSFRRIKVTPLHHTCSPGDRVEWNSLWSSSLRRTSDFTERKPPLCITDIA